MKNVGMKKPCDTCKVSICTYYEYPCSNCTYNPHTTEEIEEEIKRAQGNMSDLYVHYKK